MNLTVEEGECLRLDAPSGTGKTTLMLTAAGLISPSRGKVTNSFQRMGFVFQDDRLLPWLTAIANVELALTRWYPANEAHDRALHCLQQVGLADDTEKRPGEMSGGMCRRVNLARALAVEPDLLFLDEAFSSLDESMTKHCMNLVTEWQKHHHGTIIATAHDNTLNAIQECRVYHLPCKQK